ncbi:MAG TPA: hypothetical protein DCY42_02690 [Chloroflexi bacterium]|nr:hypothetical protein [Chloroflexota bacterium]
MTPNKSLQIGDLVTFLKADLAGKVGIVSRPILKNRTGHVLVHVDGTILGRDVSPDDVEPAGHSSEGFAQLGYLLIKLGSHVIEKKLLVYRT